jgi:hypothetical protein
MRNLLLLPVLLVLAMPVRAADKPHLLSAKEIADGWILLFDGETPFGWTIDGEGKVAEGMLELGSTRPTTLTCTTEFGTCEFRLEYRTEGQGQAKLSLTRGASAVASVLLRSGREKGWATAEGRSEHASGRAKVEVQVPSGLKLAIRSLKLRPLGLEPIYNGKDLTGWKEFPGRKSRFTVTSEGWLNIKDGPGDLQTDGQWADFVLQLDCISNGKHLNSGVFFRCRPGEYQQGYEAQIRNQFTVEPTQEYTLEEYDAKTGERTGTKKVKYTAVDYGTGAIYRRQPARREVAKDNEWFTMTLVAHGRHMAVWVNGIQVTDWTDNRPLRDNARNGCRLEKGPISLQGHDPTTDLSFRNLRIAELPPSAEKP